MDESRGAEPSMISRLAALLFCAVAISGCVGVEIREQVPPALASEAVRAEDSLPAEHDLAILAIDFSPPLDYQDLWAEVGEVTLLVAVENRGLVQEQDIRVSASLTAPRRSEILSSDSTTLKALAPGEVQVVRFGGIPNVPYRPAYRLEVRVSPVADEAILINNAKVYELSIAEPPQTAAPNLASPLRGP